MDDKKSNRSLETLIATGTLHIDAHWGIKLFATYLHEISLVSSGIPFKELGMSQRRARSQQIEILSTSGSLVNVFTTSTEIDQEIPSDSIAKVSLSGMMTVDGGMSSWGMKDLSNTLIQLDRNEDVTGVIVEADTGGGESLAGQLLKNTLSDMRKPNVMYAHFLGSAGYNAALGADEIITSGAQSQVGSIGSMISINKEFIDYYKDNIDDIYSDLSPNKNEGFRSYLEGDNTVMKGIVRKSAKAFRSEVSKGRTLRGSDDYKEETLSGGMFYTDSARRRGLIDGSGTLNYAISRLKRHAKFKEK